MVRLGQLVRDHVRVPISPGSRPAVQLHVQPCSHICVSRVVPLLPAGICVHGNGLCDSIVCCVVCVPAYCMTIVFISNRNLVPPRIFGLPSPNPSPRKRLVVNGVCGRIHGSACYFPRASFNSSIKLKPSRRLCHFRRDLWLGNLAPPGGSKGSVIRRLWAGTRALPRPHFGTQAARALLLGPGGSPEQGCGPLERWGAARAAASNVVSTMLRHSRVLVTGHWTSSKETGCIVWPSALRAKTTPSSADAVVT